MIDTSLKYNFPTNNGDPFETNFDGNFFVYANAFSNLSRNLSDFSFESFEKNIPTGYKTIIVCHRIAHFENGKLKKEWPFKDNHALTTDKYSGKYFLTSNKLHSNFITDWNRNIESPTIFRPETKDATLNSSIWDDYETCKEYALKLSVETKTEMLVSVVLDTHSWH